MTGPANGRAWAAVILALLVMLAVSTPALAESDYKESKLEAFVTAVVKVDRLIDSWTPRIRAAESREQADKLNDQANSELRKAIEETDGITIAEYRKIEDQMRKDVDLLSRIQEIYNRKASQ